MTATITRTSEAPLKQSLVYYNLTTYALHTSRQGQRQTGIQTGSNIQDQMMRPAETLARD